MRFYLFAFIYLLSLSTYAQSREKRMQENDTAWRATLTYSIYYPGEYYNGVGYLEWYLDKVSKAEHPTLCEYSENTQSGSLSNVLRLLYDSLSTSIVDSNSPYVTENYIRVTRWYFDRQLFELARLSFYWSKTNMIYTIDTDSKNIHNAYRFDTIRIKESIVNGLMMNQEWFYDMIKHKILVKTTDIGLFCPSDSEYPIKPFYRDYSFSKDPRYMMDYGTIKFCSRSDPSSGLNHDLYNPDFAWGEELSIPIVSDDKVGSKLFTTAAQSNLSRNDSIPFRGEVFYEFTTPLKTISARTLADWIWYESRNGSLESYANDSGKIGKKLGIGEVISLGTPIDTLYDENGIHDLIKMRNYQEHLCGVRIIQEIIFNKRTFRFESKITYAGLIYHPTEEDIIGYSIKGHNISRNDMLYWVKFKN